MSRQLVEVTELESSLTRCYFSCSLHRKCGKINIVQLLQWSHLSDAVDYCTDLF